MLYITLFTTENFPKNVINNTKIQIKKFIGFSNLSKKSEKSKRKENSKFDLEKELFLAT